MSLNLIFHIADFHNLKIVNNIFFFIFEGGLIFLSGCVIGLTGFFNVDTVSSLGKGKLCIEMIYRYG